MSSVVAVTMERTIGFSRSLYTSVLAFVGFLAASAALFALALESAEGTATPLAALWATSASPFLPALAALLGMDTWSDERRSGRIETLLSSPVRERDLVLGKFLGVWTISIFSIVAFHIASAMAIAWYAPRLMSGQGMFSFLPAFVGLSLQMALWCAVSVMMSAMTRNAALAASFTIALTVALPRGIWWAMQQWVGAGRTLFGEMPIDAHAYDFASGLFSSGAIVFYIVFTFAALFVTSKAVASLRFAGRGSLSLKYSTFIAMFLAVTFAVSISSLAMRLDVTVDIPTGHSDEWAASARTKSILSEARGGVEITLFLSRKDPMFRPTAHILRAIASTAESSGGERVALKYVDPVWDIGPAERLVRAGAKSSSVVFSRGSKMEVVPVASGLDDRTIAAAIRKVALPPSRRTICWTSGHGETSFESYGNFGMSDIARDLVREGYRNQVLELSRDSRIPDDAALVIISGAKDDFARIETGRLDAYLRQGGRLMVLMNSTDSEALVSLLSTWGVRPAQADFTGAKTLSGSDVIVDAFGEHAITEPLKDAQVVFENPVAFFPSAAAESSIAAADRIEFSELAKVGQSVVAVVAERGSSLGEDIAHAIRPTRVVAIGDATFVMNAQLSARANANRDFFLNVVAYLAGTGGVAKPGESPYALISDMDRTARMKFAATSSVAIPLALALIMCAMVAIRRRC